MATLTWLLDVNAPNAAKTFDEIKLRIDKLDENLRKTRQVTVGDRDAMATFAKLDLQADRFKDKLHGMPLTLEGAAKAEAQLLALEATADRLDKKLGGRSSTGKMFSGFLGFVQKLGMLGATGLFQGLSNSLGQLPGILGSIAAQVPMLAALGTGFAIIAGAAAALVIALAPLAAALIPVTLGFGALAVAAGPTVTKVFTALTESGKKLQATINSMTPTEYAAYKQMLPLKDAFHQLNKAVQPEILKAFGDAAKIVKQLMPALKPLLEAAGKAVDYFLKQLLGWLKSPSGQAFIHWLETQGPKDIANFGKVMWDLAKGVGVALDHIYRAGKWLDGHLHDLFTVDIPASLDILKESVRIDVDKIELFFLNMLHGILDAMSKIPFIGHYFKKAADDVGAEMRRMQTDVQRALGNIQGNIDRMHGKAITLRFSAYTQSGVGHAVSPGGYASGTAGAAPGWAWVGERGPELVRMRGGEQVIPAHVARGYASGAGLDFRDTFSPSPGAVGRSLDRLASAAEAAVAAAMRKYAMTFTGGAGGGSGGAVEALARRMFPWPGYMWTDFTLVENREAGWNTNARNPSSGAYGLAQFIGGPSEYYQYGGNPYTAAGQLAGMFNYIRQRYGNPLAAWGHEMSYGWYDRGGYLPPGLSLAYNGTGRPEPVGGGNHYHITVNVAPTVNKADVGRVTVEAIKEFEKRSGAGWRK